MWMLSCARPHSTPQPAALLQPFRQDRVFAGRPGLTPDDCGGTPGAHTGPQESPSCHVQHALPSPALAVLGTSPCTNRGNQDSVWAGRPTEA